MSRITVESVHKQLHLYHPAINLAVQLPSGELVFATGITIKGTAPGQPVVVTLLTTKTSEGFAVDVAPVKPA